MIIASDIHDSTGNRKLHDSLEEALEKDIHKTLIIAGDFTKKAGKEEYLRISNWLSGIMSKGIRVVIAVGNHDMSQSILITRIPLKKGYKRFSCLMDMIGSQDCVVARMDEFDAIYRIGSDVFYSARSIHSKVYKGSRIKKDQFYWAADQLLRNGLTTDNGYRLHLVTHQSLWELKTDAHGHINKRKRLVKNFLQPFGFSTAINGHNHRFDCGERRVKKGIAYSLYHIQAPTLSERTKGRFIPGFVSWDPAGAGSPKMISI